MYAVRATIKFIIFIKRLNRRIKSNTYNSPLFKYSINYFINYYIKYPRIINIDTALAADNKTLNI